jgi:hypothetical protein
MFLPISTRLVIALLAVISLGLCFCNTSLRAADEPAAAAPGNEDAAKAKILQSDSWRQTLQDLEWWLSVQVIYNPQEVAQLRAQFRDKIDRMSASELTQFQQELQAKLAVLSSPEAQETRSWAEAYLQAASESKAAEFRKRLPDVARMTASQIEQAIQANQRERSAAMANRKAFDQMRQQQVSAIRDMQQQRAEAAARASQASAATAGTGPGFTGSQYAPRRYERYPTMFDRYWGPYWGGWGW